MIIAIPKETMEQETRVALTPNHVTKFLEKGICVQVEHNAGIKAFFTDNDYIQAGATICKNYKNTIKNADIILKIHTPQRGEISYLQNNQTIICDSRNITSKSELKKLANKNITLYGLQFIPRISRAQNMDILSSQNNLTGYEAVIMGAGHCSSSIPMMITAAGIIPPLKILIIGLGVAGLQAIATAHRLGAQIYATDINHKTEEQALSLGAKFIKELTSDFLSSLQMIITTVAPINKKTPNLLSKEQLSYISPNCVIIDTSGHNINKQWLNPQTILIQDNNLIRFIPHSASILYSENIFNFCNFILDTNNQNDEIVTKTQICSDKQIKINYLQE